MNTNEQILLVQLLLQDIRNNWSNDIDDGIGRNAKDRARKASQLCEEIAQLTGNNDFIMQSEACEAYIRLCDESYPDGRFFRDEFPLGYIGMWELHGLKATFADKSFNFKNLALVYLTRPDLCFSDWNKLNH